MSSDSLPTNSRHFSLWTYLAVRETTTQMIIPEAQRRYMWKQSSLRWLLGLVTASARSVGYAQAVDRSIWQIGGWDERDDMDRIQFFITDGQQRVTTLFLMYLAILHLELDRELARAKGEHIPAEITAMTADHKDLLEQLLFNSKTGALRLTLKKEYGDRKTIMQIAAREKPCAQSMKHPLWRNYLIVREELSSIDPNRLIAGMKDLKMYVNIHESKGTGPDGQPIKRNIRSITNALMDAQHGNARGTPLHPHESAWMQVCQMAMCSEQDVEKLSELYYTPMIEGLGGDDDEIIRYLTTWCALETQQPDLNRSSTTIALLPLIEDAHTQGRLEKFLTQLRDDAITYGRVSDPLAVEDGRRREPREKLRIQRERMSRRLTEGGNRTHKQGDVGGWRDGVHLKSGYGLMMILRRAVDEGKLSEAAYMRCVEVIECYIICKVVIGEALSATDQTLTHIALYHDLTKHKDPAKHLARLLAMQKGNKRWPNAYEVRRVLTGESNKDNSDVYRYILERIETYLAHGEEYGNNKGRTGDSKLGEYLLEGLMPATLTLAWRQAMIDANVPADHVRYVHGGLVNTIGNRILTRRGNALRQVETPADAIRLLENANKASSSDPAHREPHTTVMTAEIARRLADEGGKVLNWGPAEIRARAEKLVDLFFEIWPACPEIEEEEGSMEINYNSILDQRPPALRQMSDQLVNQLRALDQSLHVTPGRHYLTLRVGGEKGPVIGQVVVMRDHLRIQHITTLDDLRIMPGQKLEAVDVQARKWKGQPRSAFSMRRIDETPEHVGMLLQSATIIRDRQPKGKPMTNASRQSQIAGKVQGKGSPSTKAKTAVAAAN